MNSISHFKSNQKYSNHWGTCYTVILFLIVFFLNNSLVASDKKTVLFDESHGQLFLTGKAGELDLSDFATLFEKEGWIVKTSNTTITDEVLTGVDALIIPGAFKPITQDETKAILNFVQKGGNLSMMLHIGSPFAALLHTLNVDISNGIIHEKENLLSDNDLEFNILDLNKHALTENLKQFSIHAGWALMPTETNAQIIARTSAQSWIDLNGDKKADATQAFAMVVAGSMGAGHFVVFSDDAIFQNKFLKEENYLLGKNLADWLKE